MGWTIQIFHISHTDFTEIFPKTLEKIKFGKDWKKAGETPGDAQMQLDSVEKEGGGTVLPKSIVLMTDNPCGRHQ